jgi:vitamin B12 transporter
MLNNDMGFSLEAGGRWNHHSEYGSHFVYNLNPSVLLNKQLKVFLNISSGYKTPSLYQLYSEFGNAALKPEDALTFEAGAQFFASNDLFNARATFFNRHVNDVIAFIYNPATFNSQYVNQDEQEDHGVEAEASIKIDSRTTLKLNYTYVDGKITTKNNGKDTTFFNLFRRPKHTIGASIGVQLTKQIFFSSNFQSLGERFDQIYDASFNLVNVPLKGYILWDMYVEFGASDRLKLFGDVRNITGSQYQEVYGYRSPGFNGYVGVRLTL